MTLTLLYLLKANVVLVLFVAAYYGLLRGLTFFGLNRAYLVLAVLFAAVYPALPVPALLPAVALVPLPVVASSLTIAQSASPTQATAGLPWLLLGAVGYGLGVGALLLRLLGQLLSLGWVRARSRPAQALGQPVRVVPGAGGAFSFGGAIYLSAAILADAENLPAVLHHEQAHVHQWHTLDVLLVQTATALAWLNPAAWLLRRAVLDNLEYLADRAALQSGLNRRAYQYSLLRLAPSAVPAPALAFHFSLLTLKNRIAMLNQPTSPTRQLGRYFLAAPLVMALALGYSGARAQTTQTTPIASGWHIPANTRVYIDGSASTGAAAESLDPKLFANINVVNGIQGRIFTQGTGSVIAITTTTNKQAPAIRTLDAQLAQVTALVPSIEPKELPKSAQEYIAHNFPDCRLAEINKILPAANQKAAYQVNLAKGRRPQGYLLFDSSGSFLEKI